MSSDEKRQAIAYLREAFPPGTMLSYQRHDYRKFGNGPLDWQNIYSVFADTPDGALNISYAVAAALQGEVVNPAHSYVLAIQKNTEYGEGLAVTSDLRSVTILLGRLLLRDEMGYNFCRAPEE